MNPLRYLLLLTCVPALACVEAPLSPQDWDRLADHRWSELERPAEGEAPANAAGNEVWDDEVAAWLGRDLYFDPALSGSGTVSCQTCHDAAGSGSDPRGTPFSTGADGVPSDRNAPTIVNSGLRSRYSWFARLPTLWGQIRKPLSNAFHDIDPDRLAERVCGPDSPHRPGYEAVFGDCPPPCDEQTPPGDAEFCPIVDNTAKALGAYVRTLEAAPTAFDAFMGASYDELDLDAMPAEAVRGARLFVGRASCDECHAGPLFSDGERYTLGIGPAETERVDGVWQTYQVPPLRGVASTGPYMHDGSRSTLWDVIEFYEAGGDGTPGVDRPIELQPLVLSGDEVLDLQAFLVALDTRVESDDPCWLADSQACCEGPRTRPWTDEHDWTWDDAAGACR